MIALFAVLLTTLFCGLNASAQMTLKGSTPAEGSQVPDLKCIYTEWTLPVNTMEGEFDVTKLSVKDATGAVVATGVAGRNIGDWSELDFRTLIVDLDKTLNTPGEYTIEIAAGLCKEDNWEIETPAISEAATVHFSIGGEKTWPALKALTPGIYPASGTEIDPATIRNITINKVDGLSTTATELEFLNNGTPVKMPLTLFYGSYLCAANQVTLRPGTLTLTLPEGFFADDDYRDSGAKGGKYSAATEFSWTVVGEDVGPEQPVEFAMEYIYIDDPEAGMINVHKMSSIGIWKAGAKLRMAHTLYDKVGYQLLNIWDNTANEGVISLAEMRKDATELDFVYSPSFDVKFYEGHEYTLTIDCYEENGPLSEIRKYGSYTKTFTGTVIPYQFSPVKLVQTIPAEAEVLTDRDQIVELFYSAPVDIVSANINAGFGSTTPVQEFYSNKNKDHWYVRLGKSNINYFSPSLYLIVAAKDMNGLVLEGNGGVEAGSVTSIEWENHFANPVVTVLPAVDEAVTVLDKFTVTEPKKNQINWGGATEGQLLSATGRVVTTVDNNNVELYYKGQDFTKLDLYDVEPDKVVINLKKAVTAPGKYILNLPFGCFTCGAEFSSQTAQDIALEYIINGTPQFGACTVKDGAKLSSLGLVGWYTESEVEAVEGRNINILDEMSEVVASLPINVVPVNGVSFVFADFTGYVNEEGVPFVPQTGKLYTIVVPRNALILPGTDMKMPTVRVSFEGATNAANVETVALTQVVAGHSTTVSQVVRGTQATINVHPVAGWRLARLTFNGEDATANVQNGIYTTPAIDRESQVEATLEYDGNVEVTTGVDQVVTDFNLNVWSENGAINLRGLKQNMKVDVYTVGGAHISGYTVTDESVNSIGIADGIYIVVITEGTTRQAVKIDHKR